MARASDHRVCALHRFDRHHGRGLHGDRLADVEPGDRIGHRVADVQVGLLICRGAAGREHAFTRQEGRQEGRGVDELDALLAEDVGDRRDQRVGALRLESHEHAEQRHVGHDVGEELRVLDLAGHDRLAHSGVLQEADALPQLPERDPVQIGHWWLGRFNRQRWKRLFLDGEHGHAVSGRPGRVKHKEGKPAVAGDEP